MSLLPIAVRAYTESRDAKTAERRKAPPAWAGWSEHVLNLDTETTIDATQRLTFGSYRFCLWSAGPLQPIEEGLFYADELPQTDPEGFARLKEYVSIHRADVAPGEQGVLQLRSRREFVNKVFWPVAYKSRAVVVGFNLPFDLSRLAVHCGEARGRFRGGFSLGFWDYWDKETGRYCENRHRPRICVKSLDSKRSFIGFTRPAPVDREDQIPEDSDDGAPDARYTFRGYFLDLRTLAFALTNEGHSLASACKAFGVEHAKETANSHGRITPEYIDYNRRDVLATQELLEKLRAEFDQHPIDLDPCKAYSPASIAKAYLRAMGVALPTVEPCNVS